jgi:hypothetical protein
MAMRTENEIMREYHIWLESTVKENILTFYEKLLVYNSLKTFNSFFDCNCLIIDSFLSSSKELLDNLTFEELKQLPKYHVCLYAHNDINNSQTSLFIKEWVTYLKNNKIEEKNEFPYCFLKNYNDAELPITFENSFEYQKIKKQIERLLTVIEMKTNFGTRKIQLDEFDLHLLESVMMLAYKNEYDLMLGNRILRSLNYAYNEINSTMYHTINYLSLQQNPDGYFGNYLKKNFNSRDIYSILSVSFDCICTLLELNHPDFRLNLELRKMFE